MATKVLTAPLAIIKIGGVPVGKMRNLTFTENINRASVYGIGNFTPDELPALQWSGSLSCGMYLIDFKKSLNKLTDAKVLQRNVQSTDEFADTVLLQEEGVQIDVMRKVLDTTDPNSGVKKSKLEVFASIKGCFLNRESMNLSEGQVSGRDADFSYTTPVIFPL